MAGWPPLRPATGPPVQSGKYLLMGNNDKFKFNKIFRKKKDNKLFKLFFGLDGDIIDIFRYVNNSIGALPNGSQIRRRIGTVSATWAGSAGRPGPDRRPCCWAQGGPACHPEAVSAAFTAAVEWRLMIEANTCTTQWQLGVGNGKLERICKKLDQISQKLESN